MQQRIDRLRYEITKLRLLATSCDADFRAQFTALADEMQVLVDEMQERLDSLSHPSVRPVDLGVTKGH